MKTLKFAPELCEQIIAGTKTSTWRLFDDKDLTVGDELQFINKESGICFGGGTITHLYTKTLGTLDEADWLGHERFASAQVMYETYRDFYGDRVKPDTEVKIIRFTFTPK
jgi:hypothetical protein